MAGFGSRLLAAAVVTGLAALFVNLGVRPTSADEPKIPDLTELRDAVKAASKRGDNVDEVEKALTGLEKSLAKGFAPAGGKVPPELAALRDAVEAAARKGENVTEIRKQLETVERALTGKVLTPPKPVAPPDPELPRRPNVGPRPEVFPPAFPLPNLAPGARIDPADFQKAQDLMRRAMEMRLKNPSDEEAQKLLREAQELLMKALAGGGGLGGGLGGAFPLPDPLQLPDLGFPNPGLGRGNERGRLGVRIERLSPVVVEQLGLERGQGVAVADVVEGSAAEKAGFKPHDIVIEFAGKPVGDNTDDFIRQVGEAKAGEKIDAVVLRKGKKVELKGIELPANPQPAPRVPRIAPGQKVPELKPNQPKLGGGPAPDPQPDGVGNFPGGGGNSTSLSVTNGEFTLKATQGGVNYAITGTLGGDGPAVSKVVVTDGEKKPVEAESVEKVPAEYRATVERLLKTVGTKRGKLRD